MENPLFDGVITVYRPGFRQVVHNCRYRWELKEEESEEGLRRKVSCGLFVTGEDYLPQVGDRILSGIGPEHIDWEAFLPGQAEGLSQLSWVKPYYLFGQLHHVEAGC